MSKHIILGACEVVFTRREVEIFTHAFVVLSPSSMDGGVKASLKAFRKEHPSISLTDGVSIQVRHITSSLQNVSAEAEQRNIYDAAKSFNSKPNRR